MALGGVVTWLVGADLQDAQVPADRAGTSPQARPGDGVGAGLRGGGDRRGGIHPLPGALSRRWASSSPGKKIAFAPDQVAGEVEQILAKDGDWVQAGPADPHPPQPQHWRSQIKQLEAKLRARCRHRWRRRRARTPVAARSDQRADPGRADGTGDDSRTTRRELTVRAPMTGQLIAPHLQALARRMRAERRADRHGRHIRQDPRSWRQFDQDDAALAYLQQGTGSRCAAGRAASARTTDGDDREAHARRRRGTCHPVAWPARRRRCADSTRPTRRASSCCGRRCEWWLTMDNPGGEFVAGQRAYLRFELEKQAADLELGPPALAVDPEPQQQQMDLMQAMSVVSERNEYWAIFDARRVKAPDLRGPDALLSTVVGLGQEPAAVSAAACRRSADRVEKLEPRDSQPVRCAVQGRGGQVPGSWRASAS